MNDSSKTLFHVTPQPVQFDGDGQTTLLSVLRDDLRLSGP